MTKEQARKDAWKRFCPPDSPLPAAIAEHLAFIQGFDAGVTYGLHAQTSEKTHRQSKGGNSLTKGIKTDTNKHE